MFCAAWPAKAKMWRSRHHVFARSRKFSTNACRPRTAGAELPWFPMVARRLLVVFFLGACAVCVLVGPGTIWATPPDALALVTLRAAADATIGEQLIDSA